MYYPNDEFFGVNGYEVFFTRFADSIISDRFPQAKAEIGSILDDFKIPAKLILEGGGGKSKITQSLEAVLNEFEWNKKVVSDEHFVDGVSVVSESHEIDHYKTFTAGSMGLEIEWNNKDPFYDRDLENFRKLHYINSIALGIIITRGKSLQEDFYHVYYEFLESIYPFDIDSLKQHFRISDGTVKKINKKNILQLPQEEQIDQLSMMITGSKYGTATTHMDKLLLRIDRGLGNPCPLILIGIGKERLI